jgi:methyltransferase (TIGR00027 family)
MADAKPTRMQSGRASRTASGVAMRRAAHQLLDVPLVFEDPLALKILSPEAADKLRLTLPRREKSRLSRYLRAFLAVRSRIAEDVIADAIANGTRQVVVLGAGLDTFAFRQTRDDVRIFEVDHPATQGWKRQRLAEAGIPIPAQVTFVPVDFAHQNLRQCLLAARVDPAQPTIFSWLGVTPYLDAGAVWHTLKDIADFSTAGGGVVFDYAVPPSSVGLLSRALMWLLTRRLARAGEPFRSYFTPESLARNLASMGFTNLTDYGRDELNAKYFSGRRDGLRVGGLGRVMVATSDRDRY